MASDSIEILKEKEEVRSKSERDLEQFKFDLKVKLLDKEDELDQKMHDRKMELLEREIKLHKERNEVAITVGAVQMGMIQAMVEGKLNATEIRETFSKANQALAKLDEKKLV